MVRGEGTRTIPNFENMNEDDINGLVYEFAHTLFTDEDVRDIRQDNNELNPCWYKGYAIPCTKFERAAYPLSCSINGKRVNVPCRVEECVKQNRTGKRGFCKKCCNEHGEKYSAVEPFARLPNV